MAKVILFSVSVLTGVFLVCTLPDEQIMNASQDNSTEVTVAEGNSTNYEVPEVDCFLRKLLPDGNEIIVNKTRAEVGEDEYKDYEELCNDETERRLSASSLASLAGK